MTSIERANIVLNGTSGGAIIRELLCHFRSSNPSKETLGRIQKITQMPSRGYVADILSGRRRLTRRFQTKTLNYLKLSAFERDIVELLLEADQTRDLRTRRTLIADAQNYKKLLRAAITSQEQKSGSTPTATEGLILSSFDLFGGRPRRSDLIKIFKRRSPESIDRDLLALESKGLLRIHGRRYIAVEPIVVVEAPKALLQKIDFVRDATLESTKHIAAWFGRPDESCFQSFFLSTKKSAYLEAVRDIKRYVYKRLSMIESSEPDALVQINVSMIPHVGI